MVNFALMHDFGYSLTELNGMMPWEREIYVHMVLERVREDNERARSGKNHG